MLRALLERGIVPDAIVGCSVGALNAAAIAGEPSISGVRRLEDLWSALRAEDVFPVGRLHGPWQLALRGYSICSNDGLRRVIERWLTYRRFEEASVRLHVVATSLETGREQWFCRGSVIPPLLASSALPAVLPPVEIEGELYIDGGVVDNVPVSRAIELGARRVYVMHAGNFQRRRADPRRPLDVLVQAFSIARSYRFRMEATTSHNGVELIVLPGVDPGPVRYNDFTRSRALMQSAHRAAADFLDNGKAASG